MRTVAYDRIRAGIYRGVRDLDHVLEHFFA
jgi:hypothetical protein